MSSLAPPTRPETGLTPGQPESSLPPSTNPGPMIKASRLVRRVIAAALLAGLLVPAALYQSDLLNWLAAWMRERQNKARLEQLVLETVRRNPFTMTVTERGTLDSLKNAVLASRVEGTTSIISIVPEGTNVAAGQLVCELDS